MPMHVRIVQSRKLVHMSGMHCHMAHLLQVAVLLCTVENTVVQGLCFKPRMSGSKHKSSGYVADIFKEYQLLYSTTVLFKVLCCKIKNIFFNFCVFLMNYLHEKCYKPITVSYSIAHCVSLVPRLT